MPKYSQSNINYIIDKPAFELLYRYAASLRDKAWLTVLWFTGARPSELLELTREGIIIDEDQIVFKITTKKLGFKKDTFVIEKRSLVLHVDSDSIYVKNLERYIAKFKSDAKVFYFSRKTALNIISHISEDALGFRLCPYNFRHSRMTLLAEGGATKDELMRFKGSRTDRSVTPYLHARRVEYKIDVNI